MVIYFILAFAIIIIPFIFVKCDVKSIRTKNYSCNIIFIMMLLVMGFRSEQLGMYDVEYVYLPMFRNVQTLNFKEIIYRYPIYRGSLLQVLTKFFTFMSHNENLWIFITSIPSLATLTYLIKKYGANRYTCAFSFFLFIGLRLYGSNFYLIRHSMAMAAIILAFDAIIEKRICKFIVFILIATLFHTTAILFIIAYPLSRMKISLKQLLFLSSGFIFITYLAKPLLSVFFAIIDKDNYYYNYIYKTGFTSNIYIAITMLLFFLVYVLCLKNKILIISNNSIIEEKKAYISKERNLCIITVNMLAIATFFMGMSLVISEFQRISFFFLAVSVVGISNIIHLEKNVMLRLIVYSSLFLFMIIFMKNALEPEMLVPYKTWLSG